MSAGHTAAEVRGPAPGAPAVLEPLREEFFRNAAQVDCGERDTRPGLRLLGEHDVLALGAPGNRDGHLPEAVRLIEEIAASCMSSAFSLWAQRMVIEFLELAAHSAAAREVLPGLRSGELVGCTAMASALRDVSGIEEVPVRARRVDGGLVLDGPIRWASNLFPGAVVVLPVHLGGEDRAVVCLRTTDAGVRVHDAPTLMALGATASCAVTLSGVRVPSGNVLTEDLPGFVQRFRPTFLLLQTALCSGLAGQSLRGVTPRLGGLNAVFADDAAALEARHASVRGRLLTYAAAPSTASVAELLRLRLDGAHVAGEATRLEVTVCGGAGYLAGSPANRRLREAAFLPVQSPTEGQLRWELSKYA